jgi:hypothetical protein
MPRISLNDASFEAAEADALHCKSCSGHADEGEQYCFHCNSYWESCDDGLWADYGFEDQEVAAR